ncbi:glucose dehydrogenase [FAD, quinone]-like [Cydia splendana]|uniref:glucose dehydrogenase [FAD, quinone]-like n=1 Tax=Cydia splendana TaxID=1100963 RepID=UPI00300D6758
MTSSISILFIDDIDEAHSACRHICSCLLTDGDSFDYIVVGAGGAGAPAAARLALSGAGVLLVEAGGDPNLNTRIPGIYSTLLGLALDWQYPTVTNNISCLSYSDKQCRYGRGKCLGGSTSINFMMYVRGNHRDYDELGIEGCAWKDLKPYFLKYEGLQDLDKLPCTSVPYHNTSGTMKMDFSLTLKTVGIQGP